LPTPLTLQVKALSIRRGERTLFDGLSFRVQAGEAVALTGANGAGKTSLLRAIGGLLRPASGAVRFEGAVDGETPLHLVGHQDGLKSGRTAAEELRFWARFLGGSRASADAALERFDLARLAALEVRRLSAGQRRRLALARLAAAPRPLWLLDEPMAPLDADWRVRFGAIMAEHLTGGGLIIAAVHDPLPVLHTAVPVGPA
jgi:heme exporter protein A